MIYWIRHVYKRPISSFEQAQEGFCSRLPDARQVTPSAFALNLKQAYVDGKGEPEVKYQLLTQRVTARLYLAQLPL